MSIILNKKIFIRYYKYFSFYKMKRNIDLKKYETVDDAFIAGDADAAERMLKSGYTYTPRSEYGDPIQVKDLLTLPYEEIVKMYEDSDDRLAKILMLLLEYPPPGTFGFNSTMNIDIYDAVDFFDNFKSKKFDEIAEALECSEKIHDFYNKYYDADYYDDSSYDEAERPTFQGTLEITVSNAEKRLFEINLFSIFYSDKGRKLKLYNSKSFTYKDIYKLVRFISSKPDFVNGIQIYIE